MNFYEALLGDAVKRDLQEIHQTHNTARLLPLSPTYAKSEEQHDIDDQHHDEYYDNDSKLQKSDSSDSNPEHSLNILSMKMNSLLLTL